MILKYIRLTLSVIVLASIILTLNAKSETIKLSYTSLLRNGLNKEECKEVLKGEVERTAVYEADNMRDLFEVQIITIDEVYLDTQYILLYRNEQLEFWGFLHEFARHENYLYNDIAVFCVEEINKIKEEARLRELEIERKQKRAFGITD